MGCARCVVACPTDALALRDVRDHLWKAAPRRDATRLLGESPVVTTPRRSPEPRPVAERLADWGESVPLLDPAAAQAQAARCLDCGAPGCRQGCPLGNAIPDWLAAVAAGDWATAAARVHDHSPLPELCARLCPQERLCEGACTRGRMEGAVTIGAIEGLAARQALAAGWAYPTPPRRDGRRAAVIGAGPAGLACAERLNAAGVLVTVFDRSPAIGGLLHSAVPGFKLDRGLLARRRGLFEAAGIEFRLGEAIDGTALARLLEEQDAIFLGLGAQRSHLPGIPGEGLAGVTPALEWLAHISQHDPAADAPGIAELCSAKAECNSAILVLGGGDTAMDCARSAIRLGARVRVAYRGPAERLRASVKEVALAREEGVEFLFDHAPEGIFAEGGRLRVRFVDGSDLTADLVVIAIGQRPYPPEWLAGLDVELEADGRIRVDATGRTSHPRIWAGGDNTQGPGLAVQAMAAGRTAAAGMLAGRGK